MSVTRHLGTGVSPANLVTRAGRLLSPGLVAMGPGAGGRGRDHVRLQPGHKT